VPTHIPTYACAYAHAYTCAYTYTSVYTHLRVYASIHLEWPTRQIKLELLVTTEQERSPKSKEKGKKCKRAAQGSKAAGRSDLRGSGDRREEAEPIVTKTKKRKKTKEKRACQQLAPPWWHAPGFRFI
jgi:hypothetical protein